MTKPYGIKRSSNVQRADILGRNEEERRQILQEIYCERERVVSYRAKRKTTVVKSYIIPNTVKIVKAGDDVLLLEGSTCKTIPSVAEIIKIQRTGQSMTVKIRWFYRPDETPSLRRPFHGAQELYLSDHYDIQDVQCIHDKCKVHTYEKYCQLKEANDYDYFWRFQYEATSKTIVSRKEDTFCVCEQPHNPDHIMVECEDCKEWYHPRCIRLKEENLVNMKTFICPPCMK